MAIEPLNRVNTTTVNTTVDVQPIDSTIKSGNTEVTVSSGAVKTGNDIGIKGMEGNAPAHETVKRTVDNLNKNMSNSNTEAVFGIHEGTKSVTIKIIDKKTKEVIKEFPPEKTLDMIQRVWEMAGIMVDEKR